MESLILWAVETLNEAGIPATHRFPHEFRPRLVEARGAVELSVLRAESCYLGDYVGTATQNGYGRKVSGTIMVRLFAPTAAELSSAAETAVNALSAGPQEATLTAIRLEAAAFSSLWDCFMRDVLLDFTATLPATVQEEVYLEVDGEKMAFVEEYRAISRCVEREILQFGEKVPAGILRGQEQHTLELRRLRLAGDVDVLRREDFTLTLVRPAGRVRYTGCRWTEVEESSREGITQRAVLSATGRVLEEEEDDTNASDAV